MLHLFFFGTPRVERDGQAIPLGYTRALAMLAYLALTGHSHDRDALLALLWPEFDDASARNNLRRELSRLKATLGEELLVVDRRQVGWNGAAACWVDVAQFQAQLASSKAHNHPAGELCVGCAAVLAQAAQLYADDLLAGFSMVDSPAFEEWQFFQRETLRQQLAELLQALIGWHRRSGEHPLAIGYARRWLALDPLHEPAQRELMRLYAWSGQHSAALRQYAEAARLLDAELGVAPEAETTELFEAIKGRRFGAPPAVPEPPLAGPQRKASTLPPQTTPLIGRERELRELTAMLGDPDCRLLTLVGPGGVGKTRLSVELAARLGQSFADGVCFAGLAAVDGAVQLVATIAEALQRPLTGSEAPRDQLLAALAPRRLLLVLDNVEHLLDQAELLSDICLAAPGVKLLATSREALNLREERRYPLDGLDLPVAEQPRQIADSGAVQLFVERARGVRHDFALEAEQAAVARICRLVSGVPLAVELAATWAASLSCGEIAREIERNMAFLAANVRNLPERHRSMEAVFDHSWQLLGQRERACFMRLSIFPGSFSRQAAAAVAGATAADIAALVDSSLVRRDGQDRYRIHELLRQFAALRLEGSPADSAQARDAYAGFFTRLLSESIERTLLEDAPAAIAATLAELDNIRAAWPLIVERADATTLRRAARVLYFLFLVRGPYQEGIAVQEQALNQLRRLDPTEQRERELALLLVDLAWLAIRIGQIGRAQSLLEESAAIHARLAVSPLQAPSTDPLIGLAVIQLIQGQYVEAARLGQAALQRCEAEQEQWNMPYAWSVLTHVALTQGQHAVAQRCAWAAYRGAMSLGNRWFAAYCLADLGTIACRLGAYADARQHYQACYAIRAEFDDPQGMALALNLLGNIAMLENDHAEARDFYERSLRIYQAAGDRGGLARALGSLGALDCRQGDHAAARRHLADALETAAAIRFVPLQLLLLAEVAAYWAAVGQPERGLAPLLLIVRHPAADRATFEQAQELLLQLEAQPAIDQRADLDALVAQVLVELAG